MTREGDLFGLGKVICLGVTCLGAEMVGISQDVELCGYMTKEGFLVCILQEKDLGHSRMGSEMVGKWIVMEFG